MDLWLETTSKTSIWNEKRTVAKATECKDTLITCPVILCETHNIMKKLSMKTVLHMNFRDL